MDLRQTIVNAVVLGGLAAGGWWLYQRLVDRSVEIMEAGATTTGTVDYVEPVCRGDKRRVAYSYKAGGLAFDREDKVECEWDVPTIVTVLYLPDAPNKSLVLSPLRNTKRVNAGK